MTKIPNVFGGKSISLAPGAFIFGEKQVSLMCKWGNFCVHISLTTSSQFKIDPFCLSNSFPIACKIVFENHFFMLMGRNWKDKTINFKLQKVVINKKISPLVHH